MGDLGCGRVVVSSVLELFRLAQVGRRASCPSTRGGIGFGRCMIVWKMCASMVLWCTSQ